MLGGRPVVDLDGVSAVFDVVELEAAVLGCEGEFFTRVESSGLIAVDVNETARETWLGFFLSERMIEIFKHGTGDHRENTSIR